MLTNMKTKKKCNLLIPEEKYNTDFQPFTGFYEYHVKGKRISVELLDIQNFGVNLRIAKREELGKLDIKTIPLNTIVFSSSKKKNNVKNLMWYIRCLPCHPENIVLEQNYYRLVCSQKNKETDKKDITMKGIVTCDVWNHFIKELTNQIKTNENN